MVAWLPTNWTGRFLSTGNGGLGGCIQTEDLGYAVSLGFADFVYRALHTGIVLGKQIAKAFYGKPHQKSYYLGCSTGGRQGFKNAQSFPNDFGRIVAGAPAFSFSNLTSWSCNFLPLAGTQQPDTFVPANLWSTTIQEDIFAQCDELDGAKDDQAHLLHMGVFRFLVVLTDAISVHPQKEEPQILGYCYGV